MKKNRFTPGQLEFLRIVYQYRNVRVLTRAFNAVFGTDKTEGQIKSALANHHIKCGRTYKNRIIERRRLLTDEQEAFVRENYPIHGLAMLTALLNERFGTSLRESQIKTFVANHGIRSGRTGCFEKGHKPWNTGTKGLTHANRASFVKGHVPANRKPIGHERTCRKDGFILVKVAEKNPYTGAPTRYKYKHVHVWEQAHGPVPDGMVVAFRDGDKQNTDIGNLMLISRAELLRLNQRGYGNTPIDLKPSVLALARLEVKTFSVMKTKTNGHDGNQTD